VQEYDDATGEHRLQYSDGDTEWVKIGDIMQANAASGGPSGDSYDSLAPIPPEGPDGTLSGSDLMPPIGGVNPEERDWKSDMGSYYGAGGAPYPPQGAYPPGAMPYGPGMQPQLPPYGMYGPGGYGGYPSPYGAALVAHPHHGGGGDSSAAKGDPHDASMSAEGRRKTGPKPWTKEEDALLLNLVHTMHWPMKWTVVAHSLPDRTGKQCRERYVNHLNPRLKSSDWTPIEDATIFHLYNTIGSHWAKMSKIIPGRTDNGIKNRFHNIRRQYEREDTHRMRLSSVEDFPDEIRHDRLRKFPEHLTGKSADLWDMKSAVGVLAAQSVLGGSNVNRGSNSRFGPFRNASDDGDMCVRCGLLVPSVHTGTEVCTKTGWCQTCTRIPPNISGNLLRECLNLRRTDNVELREIIESWEDFHLPGPDEAWPYRKIKEESSSTKDTAGASPKVEIE
jgi:Myb-like DNA-binding domain